MPIDAPPRRLEANGSALADEVYQLLALAILDGRLVPGERVRDVEIAEKLGISRTPVREAIQRLGRQGVIQVSPHKYTRITVVEPHMTRDAVEILGLVAGAGLTASLARISDDDLAEAVAELDEMVDAAGRDDFPLLARTSGQFYRRIALATENQIYIAVLKELSLPAQYFLATWVPYPTDTASRVDSYVRLRAAVGARDAVTAEQIVREQHELR